MALSFVAALSLAFYRSRSPVGAHAVFAFHVYAFLLLLFCVATAVPLLKLGGRLIAPASIAVPAGIRELARDERHWVGEKVGDVIPLARARR